MDRRRIVGSCLVVAMFLSSFAGCDSPPSSGTSTAPVGHTGMPLGPAGKSDAGPAAPAAKK
jgi:hypothetical protein